MVNGYRIKEYTFANTAASDTGSNNVLYSQVDINGEVLRIDSFSNYTGSIYARISGYTVPFLNATATSGTNKWETFPLTNNTGSFVMNGTLQLGVSGLASGTANTFGPISVVYR